MAARLANLKCVIIYLGGAMDQPTRRELQVRRRFALGKSTKEVAAESGNRVQDRSLLGQLIYVGGVDG